MSKRLLILGGTSEARALANQLNELEYDIISSLAGRTDNPLLPDGSTRIGGFGGVDGLSAYLKAENINLLIDATHPFAARISSNAVEAAHRSNIQIIRLERPPWSAEKGDIWHHVQSLEDAVAILPEEATAFVTIGRQQLGAFLERDDLRIIARAIEEPKISLPGNWKVLLDRPPFSLKDELALFQKYQIDVLVTKNAGGSETREKLLAARQLQKPVIIVNRLPKPPVPLFETGAAVVDYLKSKA
ncbi:MAG: cobalt-precorrin-6A reductase [Hyphomicrobiales bacterium]